MVATVGRINFEDKKFRGFRGYLLNLEIKYPCNSRFCSTCTRGGYKCVAIALWKYFKRAAEVKTSLYHRLLAVYIKQHFHAGPLLRRFSA